MSGKQIKHLRAQKGWTAEDLAEESGIHPSTISRMERDLPVSKHTEKAVREALVGAKPPPPLPGNGNTTFKQNICPHCGQEMPELAFGLSRRAVADVYNRALTDKKWRGNRTIYEAFATELERMANP